MTGTQNALIVLVVFITLLAVVLIGEAVESKYPVFALALIAALGIFIIFGKAPEKH
jgi:hypothetical protein